MHWSLCWVTHLGHAKLVNCNHILGHVADQNYTAISGERENPINELHTFEMRWSLWEVLQLSQTKLLNNNQIQGHVADQNYIAIIDSLIISFHPIRHWMVPKSIHEHGMQSVSIDAIGTFWWATRWEFLDTLKKHQKFLANAIFQKFLIIMVVYEKSICFPLK